MQINSKAILERMREQIFADITPLEFLLDIMRNDAMPYLERRDAAVVCLPYCHPKLIAAVVRNDQNDGSYPILERIERVIRETDGSTARIERGTTLADIDSKVVSAVPGGGEVQGSVGRKRVG